MPEINIGTGRTFLTHREIKPVDETSFLEGFKDAAINIGRGWSDENTLGLATLFVAKNVMNENKDYEYNSEYNVLADPQLEGLTDYLGNFMHSNSAEHTKHLIERFYKKQKQINGSPSYMIGRILGGLTDPSSLFAFTKGGRYLLTGSRLKRSAGFGGIVAAEESSKRLLTDERPLADTLLISAGGFIIPAMFPSLPVTAGKKFDKLADTLDEADDIIFNSKYTAGAAAPKGSKLKTETELQAENKIQPTGLGIFGEQGPYNPLFRVLKNGSSNAQEMIESILEGALYQVKNFKGGVTGQSIERNIYKRYVPTVLAATKKVESAYNKYLQRSGVNQQGFLEKNLIKNLLIIKK
jgi:hypothetical protein